MNDWDWAMASDVANTITSISAVAGVITAAVLGLKAIRIAAQDHDRGAQEFLYAQVDVLLQSGLALTAAASQLAMDRNEGDASIRDIDRQAENFRTRLRLLRELKLVDPRSEAASACDQFAQLLVTVAKSSHHLLCDGRHVLAPTIFDGQSDGAGILSGLATRVHGYAESEGLDGNVEMGSDGQGVSPEFDGSASVAAKLRAKLADASWTPSINQSLRLVIPWIRSELGWLYVQAHLDDGTPLMLMETLWVVGFDETATPIEESHPSPLAADWLDRWPGSFFQVEDHGDNLVDDPQAWLMSPEKLTAKLFDDVSGEFIARLPTLVREMRARLEPEC